MVQTTFTLSTWSGSAGVYRRVADLRATSQTWGLPQELNFRFVGALEPQEKLPSHAVKASFVMEGDDEKSCKNLRKLGDFLDAKAARLEAGDAVAYLVRVCTETAPYTCEVQLQPPPFDSPPQQGSPASSSAASSEAHQQIAGKREREPEASEEAPDGARKRARGTAVALRPDEGGTLGRPEGVKSNSACVKVDRGMEVFQYDVTFHDAEGNLIEKLPEVRRRAIVEELFPLTDPGKLYYAYDGASAAWTPRASPATLAVKHGGIEMRLLVTRQFQLDSPNPEIGQEQLRCLQAVLTHDRGMFCKRVGTALLDYNGRKFQIPRSDKDILFGHRQTVVLANGRYMLQCDLAVGTVRRPIGLVDLLCEELGKRTRRRLDPSELGAELGKPGQLARWSRELKNKKMTHRDPKYTEWATKHANHRQKRRGPPPSRSAKMMHAESAREFKFTHEKWGEISVEEFFSRQYGIKLRHPELPCVGFGKDGRNRVPLELCEMAGGESARAENPEERTAVLQKTSEPPAQRYREIKSITANVGSDATCEAFGLSVGGLEDVPCRVLTPMNIQYRRQQMTPETDGKFPGGWRMPNGEQFYSGGRAARTFVAVFHDGRGSRNFISEEVLRSSLEKIQRQAHARLLVRLAARAGQSGGQRAHRRVHRRRRRDAR